MEENPFASVHYYVARNYQKIVRSLTGLPENRFDIDFRGLNVQIFSESGPMSNLYNCDCSTVVKEKSSGISNGQNVQFFAKYFRKRNENLPEGYFDSPEEYWKVEYQAYQLCDGLSYIPKIYPEIKGRILILEYIPGKVLEKVLEEQTPEEKENTVGNLMETTVSRFHKDLKERMLNLLRQENKAYNILAKHFGRQENSIRKAVGYIRAIKGLDKIVQLSEDVVRSFSESYWPIAMAYDKKRPEDQISHGDLTPSNIIIAEDEPHVIDPKINFKNPIIDVAQLVASPGVNLGIESLDRIFYKYWDSNQPNQTLVFSNKIMGALSKIAGDYKIINPQQQVARGIFYKGILHESLKKLAKARDAEKYFPEIWQQWQFSRRSFVNISNECYSNADRALSVLLEEGDKIGICDEDRESLEKLKTFLIDEEWIVPEDLKKKNEWRGGSQVNKEAV